MSPQPGRWSFEHWVAVLSLGIAGLSLAISFVVLFSGNGKQAQFEADRRRCLDQLLSISEALRFVKFSGVVTPEVYSDFVSARVAAEKTCFNGEIFEAESAFEFAWSRSLDKFANDEAWELNIRPTDDDARSVLRGIDESLTVNDSAYAEVQAIPGAGAFPWQYPAPLDPPILP